ncbi:hypothetical protein [Methanimicrococcus hongohii]|uniref:hypothetical protein n=1 Tax=Methanimicrococcus hongohii TaxID=3028295 RepID=UPI00292F59E5|nr:hypothetical protein [Methanimicrococcus sp. Hf6]
MKNKNTKTYAVYSYIRFRQSLPICNCLLLLSAPAKPANLQLFFGLLPAIRFAFPPASALFLVIRSHSRTCRRHLQVSVSAWFQVSASACNQICVTVVTAAAARDLHNFKK